MSKVNVVTIEDVLKNGIKEQGHLLINADLEKMLDVSRYALQKAVISLIVEGYVKFYFKKPIDGNNNLFTTIKVIAPAGTTYLSLYNHIKGVLI